MRASDPLSSCRRAHQGFTLIELVAGMLVLSIALLMLSSMLFPQSDRAAKTLHRVRSAELAHSILNEIWGKPYDENSGIDGGVPACGSGAPADDCTALLALGPDGETRDQFNDVDDYDSLTLTSQMLQSTQSYGDLYKNYQLNVSVAYYPDPDTVSNTKLITIDVTTPEGEVITYNAVRSNY